MRINNNYKIRRIANERIVIRQGVLGADMTKVISFNETAEWLWNSLKDSDFTLSDATNLLMDTFAIDEQTAAADAQKWIHTLQQNQLMEE